MGYAQHRWHTEESLAQIAREFKTRGQFKLYDPSAYSIARSKGKHFMDKICEHMVVMNYSVPQLLCKKIMECLLSEKCVYNTRQVVKPYELDLYFERHKLAFEYNGSVWHNSELSMNRDEKKKLLCGEMGITLIVLEDAGRPPNYETSIKQQLINKLDIINATTLNEFVSENILGVNCDDIYADILDFKNIEDIKEKISKCSNSRDFERRYPKEYSFLRRIKRIDLLSEIRQKYLYSDEDIINKCSAFSSLSDLRKRNNSLYSLCRRRKMLDIIFEDAIKLNDPKLDK